MASFLNLLYASGSVLGKSVHSGKRITLRNPERSTYMIGAQGTGKSTLMLNLILADIEKNNKGIVVLDPHGPLVQDVLARCAPEQAERVVYFSPTEQTEQVLGLNLFEIGQEDAYDLKVGAVMAVFMHTWYGGFKNAPTLQNTLETFARTLLAAYPTHQTSFLHMFELLKHEDGGQIWQAMSQVMQDNPVVQAKWTEWQNAARFRKDTESSRNKINHILSSTIVRHVLCQPRSAACFRFQDFLSRRGVLLVNLRDLDEESQRLIGSFILTQLEVMARQRKQAWELRPCHIYADEFYKFNPQSFQTIINELRKYKVFCTIAHQELSQLSNKAARGAAFNCGNTIVFKVNANDAQVLRKQFYVEGSGYLDAPALSEQPKFRAWIRYELGRYRKQAWVDTLPPRRAEDKAVADLIRKRSDKYGRSQAEIQQYIQQVLGSAVKLPSPLPQPQWFD